MSCVLAMGSTTVIWGSNFVADERGGFVGVVTSLLLLLVTIVLSTCAMLFKEQGITVLVCLKRLSVHPSICLLVCLFLMPLLCTRVCVVPTIYW